MTIRSKNAVRALAVLGLAAALRPALAAEATVTSIDHYVPVVSTVPSLHGTSVQLYVRERAPATPAPGSLDGRVVLFVHGAGTPAEVAFDVPLPGYSWMAYLAERGFHTYAMDMTGYGRSARPPLMEDRCNLAEAEQEQVFGDSCAAPYPEAATTMASDWNDIDGVVAWLKQRHGVDAVHLVGWSQGGPRAAGYAAQHPENVGRLVLLAPAYNRNLPATAADAPIAGAAMTKQSRADFDANWERQVGCANQYDPAVADAVWSEMLASDPVGATWGPGVRRAPRTPTFGWTVEVVKDTRTPTLMVAGTHDKQVDPARVREFFADLGADEKVYIEMKCSSHNAMWERDAGLLFDATWQWLTNGRYGGESTGSFELEQGAAPVQ